MDENKRRGESPSGLGLWFWLLIIIAIFVLYCLTMTRPYCQTLDDPAVQAALKRAVASGQIKPEAVDDAVARYKTPALFDPAQSGGPPQPAEPASASQRTPTEPAWLSQDTLESIPRPNTTALKPFGYDLFSTQGQDPDDPYAGVVPEEYRIGPGDHLVASVWGRVDLELELVVDRSGRVFIPKAGQVMLAGLSLERAQAAIRSRLETVYSEFELSVTVSQLRTFRVFVFGEVERPGAHTLSGAASLVDALYRAGGPGDRGTLRRVRLVRGDTTLTVDLYDFLLTGKRGEDPRLSSGDVVFVDVVGPRVVVRGQVKRAGIYELSGTTTLRDCIALAGGFEADAYRDRIMIDRLQEADGRELIDVNLTGDSAVIGWSTPVQDGDDISVFSMFEARPNVVWLEGWVKHPGAFERADSMTVGQLIDYGEQLRPDSYLPRADLIRRQPGSDPMLIAIDLEAILDGDPAADLPLQDADRLTVYSRDQVERTRDVAIEGEILRPGTYQLFEAMRVSDLVFRAGNPTRDARVNQVEVARKTSGGDTKTILCDLEAIRRGDLAADLLLEDKDMVFVRRDPDIGAHRLVHLDGEVRFPGRYSLLREDETFSEVLERAGGMTERAFARGTVFVRAEISDELSRHNVGQILVNAQPLVRDSSGRVYREELLSFDPSTMTRMVLDVPKVLRENGGDGDVVMRPGDYVFVPATPSGVQVIGAVASPGTIRHKKGWRLRDYIDRAGGPSTSSDLSATRLVKADGQVVECRRRNLAVELGDAIFVPPRVEKKTDWLRTLTQAFSIAGGVATTYLVAQSVGN